MIFRVVARGFYRSVRVGCPGEVPCSVVFERCRTTLRFGSTGYSLTVCHQAVSDRSPVSELVQLRSNATQRVVVGPLLLARRVRIADLAMVRVVGVRCRAPQGIRLGRLVAGSIVGKGSD